MNERSVEARIAASLSEYTPEIEALLQAARQRLRAMFENGFELVFDNYNALVFGISPTERASDAFISVAGYPRWVTLFFLHGASLDDPAGLLEGEGKQVRSVRLAAAADIDAAPMRALVAQAAAQAAALRAAPPLTTVIKTMVAKRRPRRPPPKTRATAGQRRGRAAAG